MTVSVGSASTNSRSGELRLRRWASRWYLATMPALAMGAVVSMTASAAPSSVREQVDRAVRAPYEALAHRDAGAFCGAFTPRAAATIVAGTLPATTCTEAVSELFGRGVSVALPADWKVTNIVWRGNYASASVRYGHQRVASLVLRKIAHRWLIATRMRLVAIVGCNVQSDQAKDCPNGAHIVIALIEVSVAGEGPTLPPVPAKRQEGRRQRAERVQAGKACARAIGLRGLPPDRSSGEPGSRAGPNAHRLDVVHS